MHEGKEADYTPRAIANMLTYTMMHLVNEVQFGILNSQKSLGGL